MGGLVSGAVHCLATSSFWTGFALEAQCSSVTMAPAKEIMVKENGDLGLKPRSMGESCRRQGTQGVRAMKKRVQIVCYSKVNVVKKQRGMSKGLNNRPDIPPVYALLYLALA